MGLVPFWADVFLQGEREGGSLVHVLPYMWNKALYTQWPLVVRFKTVHNPSEIYQRHQWKKAKTRIRISEFLSYRHSSRTKPKFLLTASWLFWPLKIVFSGWQSRIVTILWATSQKWSNETQVVGRRSRNTHLKYLETQVHSYGFNCFKIINYFSCYKPLFLLILMSAE